MEKEKAVRLMQSLVLVQSVHASVYDQLFGLN